VRQRRAAGNEIVERGDVVQFGGVDQAHEDIADVGAREGQRNLCSDGRKSSQNVKLYSSCKVSILSYTSLAIRV